MIEEVDVVKIPVIMPRVDRPPLNIDLTIRDEINGKIIQQERQGIEETIHALNAVLHKMNPPMRVRVVKEMRGGRGTGCRRKGNHR